MTRRGAVGRAAGWALLGLLGCAGEEPDAHPPRLVNRSQVLSLLLASEAAVPIREGVTGTAEVLVEVDERGRVSSYRLVRPSGTPAIDGALARLTGTMTFQPSIRDGAPVRASTTVPFAFGGGTVR